MNQERPRQRSTPLGIVAQLTGISMMGTAVVLVKKWGRPEGTSIFAFAGWQMTAGGIMLLPLALSLECLPDSLSATNVAGYAYLGVIGGALAYVLWFRGSSGWHRHRSCSSGCPTR